MDKILFNSRCSPVICLHGVTASSNALASEIGSRTLHLGGNAADACVAIAAALNVTEPCSTGIGGDCFCLFYEAESKTVKGLNGRLAWVSVLIDNLLLGIFSFNVHFINCCNSRIVVIMGANR